MSKTAVLVLVLAASLAFAWPDGTHVRISLPDWASISVKADLISTTVWQPIHSISLGDIINAIINGLGQLIDR